MRHFIFSGAICSFAIYFGTIYSCAIILGPMYSTAIYLCVIYSGAIYFCTIFSEYRWAENLQKLIQTNTFIAVTQKEWVLLINL